MNRTSRPFLAVLAVVLVFVALAMGLAAMHQMGGIDGNLALFGDDLSDSALGWAIAIPIVLLVTIAVAAVCAGAAVLTFVAVVFAAVIAILAVLLAMTPVAIFLAVPVLAIYGMVKLFQRNPTRTA